MSTFDFTNRRVKNPQQVLDGATRLNKSMALYAANRMPQVLDVFMIVTPITTILRGLFGSIYTALWVMFWHYLKESIRWDVKVRIPAWWHFDVLKRTQEQWEAKFPDVEGDM